MTEKRFTMAEDEYTIEDNSKIISVMTREDILFTLNRLNDENEELKQENQELRQYLGWQEMELEELEDINKNVIE